MVTSSSIKKRGSQEAHGEQRLYYEFYLQVVELEACLEKQEKIIFEAIEMGKLQRVTKSDLYFRKMGKLQRVTKSDLYFRNDANSSKKDSDLKELPRTSTGRERWKPKKLDQ